MALLDICILKCLPMYFVGAITSVWYYTEEDNENLQWNQEWCKKVCLSNLIKAEKNFGFTRV